jgi:hypothetical protein
MNREIQLHDSEISAFNQLGGSTVIVFSTAYIHESSGIPAYDPGQIWTQEAVITIEGTSTFPPSVELPIWAIHGILRIGQTVHDGFIPASIHYKGETKFEIVLSTDDGSDGGTHIFRGSGVKIELLGEPSESKYFNERWRRSIE